MSTMTDRQKKQREVQVREMLDRGLTLSQMARELGITSQSVHKFLTVRGWQTEAMKEKAGGAMTVQQDQDKLERIARRKAMKETVDRSGSNRQKG